MNTPMRPINIVRMIRTLLNSESVGVRFRLNPTVPSAEITSKTNAKIGLSFSAIDNKNEAIQIHII